MLLQFFLAVVISINVNAAENRIGHIFQGWKLGGQGSAKCATGWVCSENSCYHFTEEKVTFTEALQKCIQFQAQLVQVSDEKEFEFLQSQAKNKNLPSDFWIALSDAFEKDKWNWMNTRDKVSFSRWAPGEPNDRSHKEDCAHMCQKRSWEWNDEPCSYKKQYVCEK